MAIAMLYDISSTKFRQISATMLVLLLGHAPLSAADDEIDFARQIQPILAKSCLACHGAEKDEGGLRLHRKAEALAGGDRGAAIVPGKSDESRLIAFVTGKNDEKLVMPPAGKFMRLTTAQVDLLRKWIDQGAKWPDGE